MKKIHAYIPNILLTFLLVFALLGTELLVFVSAVMLNSATFRQVTEQEKLGSKAYAALEANFASRSHSTGIPAEVFMDALTPEMLQDGVNASVEQAFDYLNGKSAAYDFTMDFTAMTDSIRSFFESYADENGFEKDAAYEEKVLSVMQESEDDVLFVADTFKFRTLYNNGWLEQGRKYLGYLRPAMIGCIVLTLVLAVLIVVLNRRQKLRLAYWYGLSALTAGVLLLVPGVYLKATDYFAGFALKDPQIYAAVVGYLRLLTDDAVMIAAVTAVCGAVLLAVFGVLLGKQKDAAV